MNTRQNEIRRFTGLITFLGLLFTAFVVGVVALMPGCGKKANDTEILIGEYSSLTGTAATFGTSTHNGLMIAVEEINASGGILGKKVKLLTEDTQSKAEEAATAVTKLINRDGVKALIGEVASGRTLAAAPIAQSNGVPLVTPASTNPKVTQTGDYIFRICYIDPFQGAVLARFAFNSLKVKRVAILKDVKNEYSVGLAEFFAKEFKTLGGEIIGEQAYSEGDNDFKAQLTGVKAANPELIFVPGYYTEAALISKQARELKITVPILGGDGWDSARLIEIGGTSMENTFYANHFIAVDTTVLVQDFVKKFSAQYHETPDALAALGYDAGRIVFDAIKRAGTSDGPKLRDAIAATRGFEGVTGSITINGERNATKSVVIIAVKDGKLTLRERITP